MFAFICSTLRIKGMPSSKIIRSATSVRPRFCRGLRTMLRSHVLFIRQEAIDPTCLFSYTPLVCFSSCRIRYFHMKHHSPFLTVPSSSELLPSYSLLLGTFLPILGTLPSRASHHVKERQSSEGWRHLYNDRFLHG